MSSTSSSLSLLLPFNLETIKMSKLPTLTNRRTSYGREGKSVGKLTSKQLGENNIAITPTKKNNAFGVDNNNEVYKNGTTTTPTTSPAKKSEFFCDENYKNTLLAYYKYMHQLRPQREWMKYKFGLRIRDMFDAKRHIKVLAVGTGAGDVDIDFLNEITTCGKERLGDEGYSVLYQVVEPNTTNIETFRNRVEHKPEYRKVKFLWFAGTFDKFLNDFRFRECEENRFDFVHFVRCFYHIDSVKTFDQTYAHLLANDGIMCAVGENEDAFWPKMMHFLAEHKMEHECFTCSGPVSKNYFLPGWLELARVRDWKYESYVQGYRFDVTPMYLPDDRDGNYLLDFAMHVKDARKSVPRGVIDDFFQFLELNTKDRMVMENGVRVKRKIFNCELGSIMITKE